MGLRTKLILPVVLALGIFAVVLHFSWFKSYVDDARTEFIAHQQDIISVLAPSLTRSILAGDLASVHGTLDRQMDNMKQTWRHFSLTNTNGLQIYPLETPAVKERINLLTIDQTIYHDDEQIAVARLYVDWQQGYEQVSASKWQVESMALFIFALATLIAMIWQNKLILEPLTKLEYAAMKLRHGDYSEKLPKASKDELGHLTEAFRSMRDELEQSNAALEARVIERTNELEKEKSRAEKANKAKSEFMSSMSHELRTPMNAILGFSQILAEDEDEHPLSETQLHFLQQIMTAGNHLLELINDVLDLSQIEAGHLNIKTEILDLVRIVDDSTTQIISTLAKSRQVTVINDVREDSILVYADQLRLHQILINLLSNAVKYNRENGTVTITVTTHNNNKARVRVSDTGVGISEQQLHKLFDPFERLDHQYGNIEGSGIGLTVTKQLIESMNGNIGVESNPDTGSSFWFDVPLAEDEHGTEYPVEMTDNSHKEIIDSICSTENNKRILYIEDNEMSIRFIAEIIKRRKHMDLIVARTAEEGIESAKKEQPDMILMDINLPGMNGDEAMSILKSNPLTQNIPIAAFTANAMQHDIDKGMRAGFDAYLTKPLKISQLETILYSHLAKDSA